MTEPGTEPRRRRSTGLIVLALFIIVLLIGEAALVAFVFISPNATKTLSAKVDTLRAKWEGTKDQPGIPSRISDAADSFYRNNVTTLWKIPDPEEVSTTFAKCGTCHTDYETRSRFTHVYMNHRVHAQEGMACDSCHTSVQHPNPPRPTEAVCAECHDQVNTKGQCDFCHPAGTLPHFYLLGAPREGVVNCASCHPKNTMPQLGERLVHVGTFSGDPSNRCLQCHTKSGMDQTGTGQPTTCNTCHGQPHPSDWVKIHPEYALQSNTCFNCHNATWCAERCHAVTELFRPPLNPLPSPSEVITP